MHSSCAVGWTQCLYNTGQALWELLAATRSLNLRKENQVPLWKVLADLPGSPKPGCAWPSLKVQPRRSVGVLRTLERGFHVNPGPSMLVDAGGSCSGWPSHGRATSEQAQQAVLLIFMRAVLVAGRRKAIPCRLLMLRMGFVGVQKTKPGVWWGKSMPRGNGCGVQTLHRFVQAVLPPWPLNTAVSLLLHVVTYQETGGKSVQEKWTRFLR